jgi:hypothetical protein
LAVNSYTSAQFVSLAGVALLVCAFVLSHYCRQFTLKIKRRWEALSAGVAVAYVFVNVIPELEEHRPIVAGSATGSLLDAEQRIYLWTLAGFVTFVGLSRFPAHITPNATRTVSPKLPFWGEMVGYSLYTLLIGYLLVHREDPSQLSLGLFVFAMGLHLFMVDIELVEQFASFYQPWGRMLLMASVLVGWILGLADALPDSFTSRLFAFVIGAVVVMSAYEELPSGESRQFWWFAGGAFCYATVLMLI